MGRRVERAKIRTSKDSEKSERSEKSEIENILIARIDQIHEKNKTDQMN